MQQPALLIARLLDPGPHIAVLLLPLINDFGHSIGVIAVDGDLALDVLDGFLHALNGGVRGRDFGSVLAAGALEGGQVGAHLDLLVVDSIADLLLHQVDVHPLRFEVAAVLFGQPHRHALRTFGALF